MNFKNGIACIKRDQEYGFIDTQGNFIFDLLFEDARNFSDGLACVQVGGKYGYIDKAGAFIIEPQYEKADSFSEGLAFVKIDGKYGYIDTKNCVIINPVFDYCDWNHFTNGVAIYCVENAATGLFGDGLDLYGFIDKTGKIRFEAKFESVRAICEGACLVKGYKDSEIVSKYYLDVISGTKIYKGYKFENGGYSGVSDSYDFQEGLALVANPKPGEGSYSFSNGYGYIDKSGNFAIPSIYTLATGFHEGLAVVMNYKDVYWSIIDKEGKKVVETKFEEDINIYDSFYNGLSLFRKDDKYGYFDIDGKIVIPSQYPCAFNFHEGMAFVQLGDKCGCIDKAGRIIIEPEFDLL